MEVRPGRDPDQDLKRHERVPIAPARHAPARHYLTSWLRLAERRVARRWRGPLKTIGLLPSEWDALREMYKSRWTSTSEIARAIGMTKGGASKLIGRLIQLRLVRKEVHEIDRRYRPIGLNLAGELLVSHLADIEYECDQQTFCRLGHKQRHRLLEALKRVALPPRPVIPKCRPPESSAPPQPTALEIFLATEFDPVQAVLDLCA
jgi:DNA-binding MarR family transcriptional regulator